jgi:recombination protein RecA
MVDKEREKALDRALDNLTKRFGDGAIMRLGEASHLDVDVIPTGSFSLDLALGVGGVPRGRVTEIYGPEGAGKTTLAQHVVAEAQKVGGIAAFIDMEHRRGLRGCVGAARRDRGGDGGLTSRASSAFDEPSPA